MTKYKARPILVEAEQWHEGQPMAGICTNNCFNAPSANTEDALSMAFGLSTMDNKKLGTSPPHMHTESGPLIPKNGWWFIKVIETGKRFVLEDAEFQLMYQKTGK